MTQNLLLYIFTVVLDIDLFMESIFILVQQTQQIGDSWIINNNHWVITSVKFINNERGNPHTSAKTLKIIDIPTTRYLILTTLQQTGILWSDFRLMRQGR